MSQTSAELDQAAAAYWGRLARVEGQDAGAAQELARRFAAEARDEASTPEASAKPASQRVAR